MTAFILQEDCRKCGSPDGGCYNCGVNDPVVNAEIDDLRTQVADLQAQLASALARVAELEAPKWVACRDEWLLIDQGRALAYTCWHESRREQRWARIDGRVGGYEPHLLTAQRAAETAVLGRTLEG